MKTEASSFLPSGIRTTYLQNIPYWQKDKPRGPAHGRPQRTRPPWRFNARDLHESRGLSAPMDERTGSAVLP